MRGVSDLSPAWLLKNVHPIIANGEAWTRASVIPAKMLIPCGKLLEVELPTLIKQVAYRKGCRGERTISCCDSDPGVDFTIFASAGGKS